MSAVMSPVGVGQQWFTNQGVILSGGKINTYAAGTTTPVATYTDNTLGTPNANPIILDSTGRYAQEIWWSGGLTFKFVITDSSNNVIQTIDNIVGINDVSTASASEWNASGLTPTYVSATSFTLVGNQTAIFTVGTRIKSVNTGGTIYSTITISAFTSVTTVTVINDSGVLDSGLSAVSYGFLNGSHPSMPPYSDAQPVIQNAADATKLIKFDASAITSGNTRTLKMADANVAFGSGSFTITLNGCTASITGTAKWYMSNNVVTLSVPVLTGTSNATNCTLTGLPAAIVPVSSKSGLFFQVLDNASGVANPGIGLITGGAGSIALFKDSSLASWTASGTKGLSSGAQLTWTLD